MYSIKYSEETLCCRLIHGTYLTTYILKFIVIEVYICVILL